MAGSTPCVLAETSATNAGQKTVAAKGLVKLLVNRIAYPDINRGAVPRWNGMDAAAVPLIRQPFLIRLGLLQFL
jgi:hypothetical protein